MSRGVSCQMMTCLWLARSKDKHTYIPDVYRHTYIHTYLECPGTKSHSTLISRRIRLKTKETDHTMHAHVWLQLDWLFFCRFSQQHQRSALKQAVEKICHCGCGLAETNDAFARLELKWTLDVVHSGHQWEGGLAVRGRKLGKGRLEVGGRPLYMVTLLERRILPLKGRRRLKEGGGD